MIDALRDYLYFVTIADQGSITRAAQVLGVPKSNLSRRLAALERNLGIQLLVRTTRKQELTASGLLVYQNCKPHITALTDVEVLVNNANSLVKGTLRLLLPIEFFNKTISTLITEFALNYPELEIHCHHYSEKYPNFDHTYDLVFVLHEQELPNSSWIKKTLLSFSQSIYGNQESSNQALSLVQLHNIAAICSSEGEKWVFRTPKGLASIQPKAKMLLSSPEMRVEACLKGVGLLKLPDYLGNEYSMLNPIKLNEKLVALQLSLLYQSRELPAKTRVFLDYFQSNIGSFT